MVSPLSNARSSLVKTSLTTKFKKRRDLKNRKTAEVNKIIRYLMVFKEKKKSQVLEQGQNLTSTH